ncbi:patatin-like phospholipase family protein [Sphingomonas nostoxanthinifaciens]|uniref:patatin-like phospholipase family protein n=1 Tax=Sphingomonas nostoxanthinifaciens TaxID=2872652 RepID=UPI001CC1E596|nr:patatin-like phospholipase family protein [Sphingomonas nostoxanthinifaciens]UAK26329.1 patatin-like phospholipase family protein [Sphingomonas nostoxanthinifaciens]
MADLPLQPTNPTTDADDGAPQDGIGLCLSGGGYRAMLFHVGTLWRLHEAGLLEKVARISSVSGGSITSAALAIAWPDIVANPAREVFVARFVDKVRALAGHTVDVGAVLGGLLLPGSVSDRVAGAYRRYICGHATLQDLPDAPRFIFNATSIQTGALWRFSKPYMGDWRVGRIVSPTLDLATAVAASSAFPPVLSPVTIDLAADQVWDAGGADVTDPGFKKQAVLGDGGIYDNLGLETVWKRYNTVLVSDAGAKVAPDADPHGDWGRGSMRIFDLVDNQVRSLRKRQLIGSYLASEGSAEHRLGAYWSIRSLASDFAGADPALAAPAAKTQELAAVATRLAAMDGVLQERLINWGYAVCGAAIRTHVDPGLAKGHYPYASGV